MGRDSDQHPMVPVPQAMRTVIEVTARILLKNQKPNPNVVLPASSPWSTLLHSVLAEDLIMKEPGYPNYHASIMDGYAIRTDEFTTKDAVRAGKDSLWTHRIVNKVLAGDDKSNESLAATTTTNAVDEGSAPLPPAIYITTGAMVPESFNCVVPIEECRVSADSSKLQISPSAALQDQEWIRPMGCDITPSSIVLPKGHTIDPVAVGLLKQSGAQNIIVKRRTRVGVLSTGNELIGDSFEEPSSKGGKIPDVNRPILLSLLSTYGSCCEPIDLGMVRDDSVEDMTKTIQLAMGQCDIIITTGGVSMGETDIVQHVLVDKCGGTLHFGRMHMKPGKPTTFVTLPSKDGDGIKLVFAMPGNPVSATVCTQLLVKPCLDLYFDGIADKFWQAKASTMEFKLLNAIVNESLVHPEIEARLAHDILLDKKRPEYHRVLVNVMEGKTYQVSTTGVQRSSRLMSLRDAEGLLVLPHCKDGKTKASKGETYPVLLLNNALGISRVQVKDSIHLREKGSPLKIAVVEVVPSGMREHSRLEATCLKVEQALSGSKSGNAVVVSKSVFDNPADQVYSFVVNDGKDDCDVVVVSCASFEGFFQRHLAVSNALNARLSKVATSLSLQARQGAASQDPKAALFEVVVGYIPEKGAILVCLPEIGVYGALSHVRGLLKHGLNLARGKAHDHHHIIHKH